MKILVKIDTTSCCSAVTVLISPVDLSFDDAIDKGLKRTSKTIKR